MYGYVVETDIEITQQKVSINMNDETKQLIENEINNNKVALFMKGNPVAPQCGFSMKVSQAGLLF